MYTLYYLPYAKLFNLKEIPQMNLKARFSIADVFKKILNLCLCCLILIALPSYAKKDKRPTVEIKANTLMTQGTAFRVINGYLGVTKDEQKTTEIESIVPMGNSRFDF